MERVEFIEVDADGLKKFLGEYPRRLERNVTAIFEPPLVTWNDFERAPKWPDSVVARMSFGSDVASVIKDVNSPVPDGGTRDTDTPIYDNNGVELREGDRVKVLWGWSSRNSSPWDRPEDYYQPSDDGRGFNRYRDETIRIRYGGTKYEMWSFDSCHNLARRSDMVLIKTPTTAASRSPQS